MPLEDQALTTAAAVLEDLPTEFAGKETRIEALINAVSKRMARRANREFERVTDLVEEAQSTGTQFLRLRHAPITVLTLVERLADDGTVVETYDDASIVRDGAAGLIFRRNGFPLGGSAAASIDRRSVRIPTPNRFRVTYTGGWVTPGQVVNETPTPTQTLPGDIEEQCLVEVANRFLNRGRNRDIDSRSTADATVTFRQGGGLLRATTDLLKDYWLES